MIINGICKKNVDIKFTATGAFLEKKLYLYVKYLLLNVQWHILHVYLGRERVQQNMNKNIQI